MSAATKTYMAGVWSDVSQDEAFALQSCVDQSPVVIHMRLPFAV